MMTTANEPDMKGGNRMKRLLAIATALLVTVLLIGSPAAAKQQYAKVKGEVVRVEQQVRTSNGGEVDHLMVRTRNGEQLRLNLGAGGACEGCFRAGDRVQARVGAGSASGNGRQVQSMQVRRNREMFSYQRHDGRMVGRDGHGGHGGGAGHQMRDRDRLRDPSSGCAACGGARGGAGTRGGGRGHGRGGG
jgi:hypothetical protein